MNETASNDGLFESNQSYQDTSPLSNQSSLAAHLRSGQAGPGFSVLAPDVQEQIVAHVLAMPADAQTSYLARMKQMDAEEMVASVRPPIMSDGPQPKTYTVKSGDVLSRIARAHNVSLAHLVQANPQIKDPDRIYPDQILTIPAA